MHQVTAFQYEVGAVRERFWGFFNSNTQNAGLAGCIVEQLSVLLIGDSGQLTAQTYDGAAMSGKKGGAHTTIQQSYQYAHFMH